MIQVKRLLRIWLACICLATGLTAAAEEYVCAPGFWHTSGPDIVDENGDVVQMRGMGLLGTWWYEGDKYDTPPTWSHSRDTYRELKELGFNCVRLLMGYISFEDEPYDYSDAEWDWLDENIAWAEENDMKIVLNMHLTQGGMQHNKQGLSLWTDEENQNRLVAMWRVIAEHYRDCTTIAGWGIINEPGVYFNETEKESYAQFSGLMQRITDAIREVDPNHMIFCERSTGIYTASTVGHFLAKTRFDDSTLLYPYVEDPNLVHEIHFYYPQTFTHRYGIWDEYPGPYMDIYVDRDALKEEMLRGKEMFEKVYGTDQIPVFIGEYGLDLRADDLDVDQGYAWISDVMDICNELGYSYSFHQYHGDSMGLWNTPSYKDYRKGKRDETLAALFKEKNLSE